MHRISDRTLKLLIIVPASILLAAGALLFAGVIEKMRVIDSRRTFTPFEISLTENKTCYLSAGNHDNPFIIMFFDPDCYLCHVATESLLNRIEEFCGITIYMITTADIFSAGAFAEQYGLNKYHQIITGRVCAEYIHKHLGIRTVPNTLIYDRNGRLLYSNPGYTPIADILAVVESHLSI